MNNPRRSLLLLSLSILLALVVSPAGAQTKAHSAEIDLLTVLPASDVVLVVEHGRIWREAVPRIFGGNTAPLAKLIAEADKFKLKTGIDVRSINRVAAGVRFLKTPDVNRGVDKKDLAIVIIAQGDFPAMQLIEAMRREEKGKVREVQHGGLTIYTLDVRSKGSTREQPEIETPAFAVLDANTIAIGDLVHVRATVDAKGGSNRLSPELVALATRNSNALVSLAGNVPPELAASLKPKETPGGSEAEQAFGKFFAAVASIRQMYASVGMSKAGIDAMLGARLGSTEQAQSLGDMLLGARQQYGVFIEDKLLRDLVTNMQISAEGDEVRLRAELPQTVITTLLSNANKPKQAAAAPPQEKPSPPVGPPATTDQKKKPRRSTRRKKG